MNRNLNLYKYNLILFVRILFFVMSQQLFSRCHTDLLFVERPNFLTWLVPQRVCREPRLHYDFLQAG